MLMKMKKEITEKNIQNVVVVTFTRIRIKQKNLWHG